MQNIKKLEGGPFGDIKKFSKSRTVPKKIQRGEDPLGTSGFVGFLEKVKMKGGPFGLSLPWRDLALGGFRIVSKKCEECSLKKKTVTAIVGHFSLKGKAPTNKRGTLCL